MLNEFAKILMPPDKFLPQLRMGHYTINQAANRIVNADGQFVAALQPVIGDDLRDQLLRLPFDPNLAKKAIESSQALAKIGPALNALQITSSVGALASIASLGVSCVGFALVLSRLSRMEGKLDDMLGKIDVLRESVSKINIQLNAMSLARVRSAGLSLERALAADSSMTRRQLALEASSFFQDSKNFWLEIWKSNSPSGEIKIPIATVAELQGRYITCLTGHLQAEFILGDEGAYRHAVAAGAKELKENFFFSVDEAFRARSDGSCRLGSDEMLELHANLHPMINGLKTLTESLNHTYLKIASSDSDMDAAREIGIEPYELAKVVRSAPEQGFFLPGSIKNAI